MKRTIVLSILVAAVAANAQTGSTTKAKAKKTVAKKAAVQTVAQAPAVAQNEKSILAEPTPAQQTTSTSAAAAAPAAAKKWSAMLNMMPYATQEDVGNDGAKAAFKTDYAIGVGYKLTDKLKGEVIGAMTYNKAAEGGKDSITDIDPAIKLGYKSETRFLGSEPIAFSGRYYVPVSTATVNRTNGTLRFDIGSEWVVNPKWTLGTALSSRLYLNTNHKKHGGNSEIRLEPEVSATYNVTDKLGVYLTEALYSRSTDLLRGEAKLNTANLASTYLGVNYSVASLIVNPFVEVDTNLDNGKSTAADVTYALNLIATF